MVFSFLASAPPREVIEAVAASIDVSGSFRMECGYVGASTQRKCGADPTRDRDPRVVDIEEVQGHEDDESDVEEEALIPPDPPPDDGAAQMEGGEDEGVFQHIFHDIVDEPPAPYLDALFEGGSEENSPGSGVETRDHGDFPVAIPEPSQTDPQRGVYNDATAGACAIHQPIPGEPSVAVEQPNVPHSLHHYPQRSQQGDQDFLAESTQQVPAELEQHGQSLVAVAAALQDLSIGTARPEPVEQLAERMPSALTIGQIPDRDQGITERFERLTLLSLLQSRGLAVQEHIVHASLTRPATHAEGLESLVRPHLVADAPTPRPASHRRTLSDTTPILDSSLPNFQVWYNKRHIWVYSC